MLFTTGQAADGATEYDEKPVCRRRGGNIRGIYVCISGRAVYDPKKPGIYARGKAEKCRRKDPPCKGNVKSQPDHARREGVSGEKREVDQKIEQIIGLDAGQFTQIAMIAQGDFLRLLHAESKERKKIFSKIFQTQIYRDVQEQLKEQGKALYIQLKENEPIFGVRWSASMQTESKGAKGVGRFDFPGNALAEAVTETLGRILKEGKEAYETMEAEETALRKESEQLHLMIGKKRGDQQDLRSVRANRIGI